MPNVIYLLCQFFHQFEYECYSFFDLEIKLCDILKLILKRNKGFLSNFHVIQQISHSLWKLIWLSKPKEGHSAYSRDSHGSKTLTWANTASTAASVWYTLIK